MMRAWRWIRPGDDPEQMVLADELALLAATTRAESELEPRSKEVFTDQSLPQEDHSSPWSDHGTKSSGMFRGYAR
jgi:hypothetical protein